MARFEVMAEGLLSPEGPVAMPEGLAFGADGKLLGTRWARPGLRLNFQPRWLGIYFDTIMSI